MKQVLFVLFLVVYNNCLCQVIDTSDIFNIDKNDYLVLKPEIEKKINKSIAPIVNKKLKKFKIQKSTYLESFTKSGKQDEIEFARDTILINEFLSEYSGSFSMATTTMGMNWGEFKRLNEYDKLLNKYYQKSLSVLKEGMKDKLIKSQRIWLDYYIKEKEFIRDLNDFGNHNSSLYNWGYYFEMLEKRVLFLKDIYQGNFNGNNTYKE
ncbi:MAG: lysozyme inhibitor LprI family protein [Leadbetterella sp.]